MAARAGRHLYRRKGRRSRREERERETRFSSAVKADRAKRSEPCFLLRPNAGRTSTPGTFWAIPPSACIRWSAPRGQKPCSYDARSNSKRLINARGISRARRRFTKRPAPETSPFSDAPGSRSRHKRGGRIRAYCPHRRDQSEQGRRHPPPSGPQGISRHPGHVRTERPPRSGDNSSPEIDCCAHPAETRCRAIRTERRRSPSRLKRRARP